MAKLEWNLQTFFDQPKLRFGIFMLEHNEEQKHLHRHEINHGFLSDKYPKLLSSHFQNSIYEKTTKNPGFTIIDDLEHYPNPTKIEKVLLEEGFKSILLTPILNDQQQVIGIMELGSPKTYALNSFTTIKLNELFL